MGVLALVCVLLASCGGIGLTRTLPAISSPIDTVRPTSTVEGAGMDETAVAQDSVATADAIVQDEDIVNVGTTIPAVASMGEVDAEDGRTSIPATEDTGADEPISRDDGVIPFGESLSPFDTEHAAITNLDPALRAAVQRAATDAADDGFEMFITSGWRSIRYQQSLLDEAVIHYGSVEEARRWVNTPENSTHVTGKAVDIGPTDAMSWLSQHGSDYGLCQTYGNEMWHYELATEPGGTCPQQLSDASAG